MPRPQSFVSEFAPRFRGNLNSLLTPVIPSSTAQSGPASRTTKRGTVVINYSEDLLGDDDFEDSDGPKRLTGLRSKREVDPNLSRENLAERLSKELTAPIDTQGIWRDWMGKAKFSRTDKQLNAQSSLPLTLIPIRIDMDIPSFTPIPALPLPADAPAFGINPALPAYRAPDPTPPYRLKDVFLWNLHEMLITPEQFASVLVNELDLPNPTGFTIQIGAQIRQQLEEYAGVALHPLFQAASGDNMRHLTAPSNARQTRDSSQTPNLQGQAGLPAVQQQPTLLNGSSSGTIIQSVATLVEPEISGVHNPDDTYRCVVNVSINLLNKLYTDKFEWSLLHPPGLAETFAKQTCADVGLGGEWVPVMAHAIYEAVLRLKKEACESGGLVGSGYGGEVDNLALDGQEAGWRYDPEHLGDEWEPKIETLSKEEMEKREGDRERQIRRLRRETARFSTTNVSVIAPASYFDQQENVETPMGRGERSKKKRRFRSLSPVGRGGTPGGTSDAAGYGGSGGGPTDWERQAWRCSHCLVHGSAAWAVRDGPAGPRTLCNNCAFFYEREKRLPPLAKNLHRLDNPAINAR